MRFPYVSSRATVPDGARVAVLPQLGAGTVSLWSSFPRGACPVSGNPILGAVHLTYRPGRVVLKLVSVRQLVQAARTAPEAQSIEAAALWLLVRPGPQLYRVRHG